MIEGGQLKEHVLNRAGYGMSTWASERYDQLGAYGFLAEQLGSSLPAISELGTYVEDRFKRGVLSERQLEAALLEHWWNHFNVFGASYNEEVRQGSVIGRGIDNYQNVALLPNVLGDFLTMLTATAQSPSMLAYLDNWVNRAEVEINGVQYGGNANYARELMELHTLGVDGGYNETDVLEVARLLTGWGVSNDAFLFREWFHDTGEKFVLGVQYPAGGDEAEGHQLLQQLANHPSTATFLATKLVARFVNETVDADIVAAASSTYGQGRDLQQVMATIFNHPNFATETHFRAKTKPPIRHTISCLQAMGAIDAADWLDIELVLRNRVLTAGEYAYLVGPPNGYPDSSPFWVSANSMMERFSTAKVIAYHGPLLDRLSARVATDGADPLLTVDAVAAVMVPGGLSENSRTAAADHVAVNAMSDLARIAAAAHIIMCSPEFVRY